MAFTSGNFSAAVIIRVCWRAWLLTHLLQNTEVSNAQKWHAWLSAQVKTTEWRNEDADYVEVRNAADISWLCREEKWSHYEVNHRVDCAIDCCNNMNHNINSKNANSSFYMICLRSWSETCEWSGWHVELRRHTSNMPSQLTGLMKCRCSASTCTLDSLNAHKFLPY